MEFVSGQLDLYLEWPVFPPSEVVFGGLSRVRGKGLFHLADKSFTGGYEMYTNFDFVLRNYHSSIFNNPGIMTLPLEFTNDMMNRSHTPPMTQRRFYGPLPALKGPLE